MEASRSYAAAAAAAGRLTWLGEALLEPLTGGTLGSMNGFGTAIADDKLVHTYVEEMIRFYLGEEPIVRSVATHDPSTHPTVVGDALEPRHVDLRAFAYGGRVLPGGLTRVALDEDALVVDSSMNGGGKDTWMLS